MTDIPKDAFETAAREAGGWLDETVAALRAMPSTARRDRAIEYIRKATNLVLRAKEEVGVE